MNGGSADGFGVNVDGQAIAKNDDAAPAVMFDVGFAVKKARAEADEMPQGVRGVVAVEEGDVEQAIVDAGVGGDAHHGTIELDVAGEGEEDAAAVGDAVYFYAHRVSSRLKRFAETDGEKKEFAETPFVGAVALNLIDDGGVESDAATEEKGAGGKAVSLGDTDIYQARCGDGLELRGADDVVKGETHFERPDVGGAEGQNTDSSSGVEDAV